MEEAGRVIGFEHQFIWDLGFQLLSTLVLLGIMILGIILFVVLIRLGLLGIKALKIYIKNNSDEMIK